MDKRKYDGLILCTTEYADDFLGTMTDTEDIDIIRSIDNFYDFVQEDLEKVFPGIRVQYEIKMNVTGWCPGPKLTCDEDVDFSDDEIISLQDIVCETYNDITSTIFGDSEKWLVYR